MGVSLTAASGAQAPPRPAVPVKVPVAVAR
jgi:hypothetical protein